MRKILIALFALTFTGFMVAEDAEARRFGGARSLGVQRNVTPPPTRPAQQQAAPAGQQQQAAPAGQAAGAAGKAPAGSRWAPVIGGLALGGLLGWLFAGNGLGGVLLLALLAFGAVMLFRAMARRAPGAARVAYAGGIREPLRDGIREPAAMPAGGSLPAGFDAEGFLRAAKVNFAKLQLANDAADLDVIREFTTEEMFAALSPEIVARGGTAQQTDVSELQAELLEVATEGPQHWASVRFSGFVRETPQGEPVPFGEIWHLVKPRDGSSGWLLAGIQQPH